MNLFNLFRNKTVINLDRFLKVFIATDQDGGGGGVCADLGVDNLGAILNALGGKTFNHGIYRVMRSEQVALATNDLENMFPEYRGQIVPFGFDWLGRYFVCDRDRFQKGQPQILLLEVGMGEALEIDASLLDFHNVELVEGAVDALAVKFWR